MSWTVSTLACSLCPPVSPAGTPRHPGASLLGGDPRSAPFPPASARSSPQMQIRVAQTFVSEADSFSDSSHIFFPLRFAQHFSFQTLGPRFTPLASAELPGGSSLHEASASTVSVGGQLTGGCWGAWTKGLGSRWGGAVEGEGDTRGVQGPVAEVGVLGGHEAGHEACTGP